VGNDDGPDSMSTVEMKVFYSARVTVVSLPLLSRTLARGFEDNIFDLTIRTEGIDDILFMQFIIE
jgi:hypothetical protein